MSIQFGPLDHFPGILERKPNLIDLMVQVRDRPLVSGVRLWGAAHPNHLYGPRAGPPDSAMNTATPAAAVVQRIIVGRAFPNEIFRSAALQRARITFDEVTRGACRFVIDPADLGVGAASILFVALQQERKTLPSILTDGITGRANQIKGAVDNADNILGPILVVPTADQWTLSRTTLVISGEAPVASAAMGVAGTTPLPNLDLQIVNPLHFVLPRPTTSITIRNTDGASALRVSHGLGQQIYEIPLGTERTFFGAVKEVCLMSAAAALCTFSVEANLNLGGSAGGT